MCYSYSGSACFESWQVAGLLWQVFAALFHTIREIQGSKLKTGHNVPLLDKYHPILMNPTSRKTPYTMVCDVVVSLLATFADFMWHLRWIALKLSPPPGVLRFFSPTNPKSIIVESVLLPEVCDSRDPTTHCHFLGMTLGTSFHRHGNCLITEWGICFCICQKFLKRHSVLQ
jgi:hypothetical protein